MYSIFCICSSAGGLGEFPCRRWLLPCTTTPCVRWGGWLRRRGGRPGICSLLPVQVLNSVVCWVMETWSWSWSWWWAYNCFWNIHEHSMFIFWTWWNRNLKLWHVGGLGLQVLALLRKRRQKPMFWVCWNFASVKCGSWNSLWESLLLGLKHHHSIYSSDVAHEPSMIVYVYTFEASKPTRKARGLNRKATRMAWHSFA